MRTAVQYARERRVTVLAELIAHVLSHNLSRDILDMLAAIAGNRFRDILDKIVQEGDG